MDLSSRYILTLRQQSRSDTQYKVYNFCGTCPCSTRSTSKAEFRQHIYCSTSANIFVLSDEWTLQRRLEVFDAKICKTQVAFIHSALASVKVNSNVLPNILANTASSGCNFEYNSLRWWRTSLLLLPTNEAKIHIVDATLTWPYRLSLSVYFAYHD